MKIAEVKVAKTTCEATQLVPIPKGIVGATVSIEYMDSAWDGLQKTVVFRSAVTKDVLSSGNEVVIPAEVVSRAGRNLCIGVYGVNAENNVVIPTIWTDLGPVNSAAAPSGDASSDQSLPVWAQIQGMIGNLDELDTEMKNDIVAAVNEALAKGVAVDEAEIRRIVADYLYANPPTVTESDPTVPAWAKQPQKPTYTASEVGALPDTYTPPNQTAQQVGADPAGTAASAVSQHNVDTAAHNDLRLALKELADRVNAALDSDDTTLDQMSEVVAYIKSNKSLIDSITTSKVSITDIVNDLVTNVSDKPLSAAQGVALKGLIDELRTLIPEAYTLPTATETTLGGVKPVTATDAMTQSVGVTEDGRLVTKPGEGGSGISVTGATVGQTVKIAAVDENGVPTAWLPTDFPSGGGGDLQWYKVAETETTEEITEYVVSQDFDGNPIKSYNPVAIALCFATPADSTQASTNGSPWIYPSASSKSNYIRAIGTIGGWKTTERTNTEVFFGSEHGLIGLGNVTTYSMNLVGLESSIMDGVRIMFNTSGDHFPVGTHFIVSVLGVRA